MIISIQKKRNKKKKMLIIYSKCHLIRISIFFFPGFV